MHSTPHYLIWFRRDLRIHDNTALAQLCEHINAHYSLNLAGNIENSPQISALFFVTPQQWLQHNMSVTQVDLILRTLPKLVTILYKQFSIKLDIQIAQTFDECQQNHITHIFANHEYELNEHIRDQNLNSQLNQLNIEFQLYHDQCILPPNSIQTKDGQMYQIFTPFYKQWSRQLDHITHQLSPNHHTVVNQVELCIDRQKNHSGIIDNTTLNELLDQINTVSQNVLPVYQQDWLDKLAKPLNTKSQDVDSHEVLDNLKHLLHQQLKQARINFPAGEVEAVHKLNSFVADEVSQYDIARDTPSLEATSRLSPYLAIGSLSPRLCYQQAYNAINTMTTDNHTAKNTASPPATPAQKWISELAWRDFYRHVLVDKPNLIKHQAYHQTTDKKVKWSYQQADFTRWCTGQTGFPLVDSAMRCLNATGFMHNRLRMVVAMFLTKDLLIDWRWGERYFMQMLIDGDFASNNGGWQWSASTGTDAAPYFRIMNPFSQSKTHDSDAIFIKTWLPELAHVEAKILHDEAKLTKFLATNPNIDYPMPMVEHKQARLRAIEAFKSE